MKKEWFSRDDLVALALPAIASSLRGVLDQANREGWRWRPREGRGGGREYHLGALPEAARIELARRALNALPPAEFADPLHVAMGGSATLQPGSSPAGAALPPSRGARPSRAAGGEAQALDSGRARLRAAARVVILNLLRLHAETGGLSMTVARATFAAHFNAGEIVTADWVRAEVGKLTVRSLERWGGQAARHGAARLGGKYGHRKGKGRIESDPALRDFAVLQMTARGGLTASQLAAMIQVRFGASIPKRTVQRFMSTARITQSSSFLATQNPDAWKNRYQAAFGSQSEAVAGLNAVWEIDASPADILTLDAARESGQRRMTLVGVIDVWSRRVKILVTETPKSTATMLLMRRAIMDWGVPACLKTDNGKDFTSAHIAHALGGLAIEHRLCPPFTPEGKPHIERFFGTLQRDFIALLPGFIGHSVADRKAIEAHRSFASRLGESDELIEVSLTAEELQSRIDDWVEGVYHRRKHGSLGTSPMLRALAWTQPPALIGDERALDTLLMEAPDTSGTRVVTKKGLRVENATFIARELGLHIGARVHVRLDPEDMGRIVVYGLDGAFICVAECPERTGLDRREVAAAARSIQRGAEREAREELKRKKREIKPHTIIDEMRDAQREAAAQLVRFPRGGATHETPALAAAAEAASKLAGERPAPRPLTGDERELAAEAAHEAEIIAFRAREAEDLSDLDFYVWGLERPDEMNEAQAAYWAELDRSPAIRFWLASRIESGAANNG